ncbi:hypothetical protein [Chamaesiphon sp.]|uniref:hypothetical protein n=1 Tax=Chamaesiphon sp. TaxID=2814140 RepID=UPI003593C4A2
MQNISKYHRAIVGCSTVVAASLAGFMPSASAAAQFNTQAVRADRGTLLIAQTTNQSNAGGTGVSTSPSGSFTPGSSVGGFSSAITGRAGSLSSRISLAQSNYDAAVANLAQAQTVQPVAADTSPVRYGRQAVADLASCGCPNADTAATPPTDRPELVAARAAEASAAAELAAAKAEAQQFIESVKNDSATRRADTTLW